MNLINKFITEDTILDGKIILRQLKTAYRVGIDAILLASMVKNTDQKVLNILDLGSGVGGVSLCILYRLPNAIIVGIEKVLDYYNLCLDNINKNAFVKGRFTPLLGEINYFNTLFNKFDIIVCNPPYYKKDECRNNTNILKNIANIESTANLKDFIKISYEYLKPKGTLYIIQKVSRLLEVLNKINLNYWGAITLYPIYSYSNTFADRAILSMKKMSRELFKISNGIIIHNKDASYTNEAIEIIKNGKGYFDVFK